MMKDEQKTKPIHRSSFIILECDRWFRLSGFGFLPEKPPDMMLL